MRNALFVFLLLNLLAFAYQKWILSPEDSVAADYLEQGFPTLAKTDVEPEQEPELDESAVASIDLPVMVEMTCKRVGPFSREQDAEKVSRMLAPEVIEVSLSSETGEVWAGFWVQVPARANYDEVQETRQKLKDAGMKDAYILSDAGMHSISLGVFRLTESAGKVIARASALGIQTDIRDRYEAGTNYWLNVSLSEDKDFPASVWQAKSSPIMRIEIVPCEGSESLS
ncbi:MAG: SPOR domain-containing protein [Gammaproteobacteria bacterium]